MATDRGVALPLEAEGVRIRATRAEALPHDHEVAVGVQRHRRVALLARGVGVDLELAARRAARRGVALPLDAVEARIRAARSAAVPRHHEIAVIVHRHRRAALAIRGVGVDLELAAHRAARRVVALPLDAVAGGVRAA